MDSDPKRTGNICRLLLRCDLKRGCKELADKRVTNDEVLTRGSVMYDNMTTLLKPGRRKRRHVWTRISRTNYFG